MKGYEAALVDQWEMTRYIAYMTYCANTDIDKRVTIYEFHPLPNDPTPEELALLKKKQADSRKDRAKSMYERHEKMKEKLASSRPDKMKTNNG